MAGFGEQKSNQKINKKKTKIKPHFSAQELEESAINHHLCGDLVKAEQGYREIIKAGLYNHKILINLGVICKNSGRKDESILLLQNAIKLNPNDPVAYLNLGNIYCDLGNFENAVALAKKSLELNANNPEALKTLGWGQKHLGALEKALTLTLQALKLKPDDPTTLMNLGAIYKDLDQFDQALASTLESLKLKPENPDALKNLSNIYMDLGKLDHALASNLKSLKLNSQDADIYIDLGVIYNKLGKHNQALNSTLKSLELKPDHPIALMNLGSIYKDLGNLDQALSSTLKSLELKPDNPHAHVNLGSIYQHLGNLDRALASTLKSLEIDPEYSKGLCKLGQIKMALGQTQEAKKDLFKAIRCNNEEYEAYLALSSMLETKKDAEAIIKSTKLARGENLNPQSKLFTEFALANCHHRLKNYDQASKHLRAANESKLLMYPSNCQQIQQEIEKTFLRSNSQEQLKTDLRSGKNRIFIVGMPRSGSTLLETTLSINQQVKGLGESRSLKKAISIIKKGNLPSQSLSDLYSQLEPINSSQIKYTTDKNL
jgi:tetratricopeptide (TPR) repeat protein